MQSKASRDRDREITETAAREGWSQKPGREIRRLSPGVPSAGTREMAFQCLPSLESCFSSPPQSN